MDIKLKVRELRSEGYIEGELSVDPLWYIIWEADDIDEYNKDYKLAEYAPEYTAFGGNGADELLVVNSTGQVFSLPTIGMESKYANKIAENIDELKQFMEINT